MPELTPLGNHTQPDHRTQLDLGQVLVWIRTQLASEAIEDGAVVTPQGQLAILCGWHPSNKRIALLRCC